MKILADENVHSQIVAYLRSTGNDVKYIAEIAPSEPDPTVLEIAWAEDRILITSDRDFGELVVRRRQPSRGILLLRFRAKDGDAHVKLFRLMWPTVHQRVPGHLVVVGNQKIKSRQL